MTHELKYEVSELGEDGDAWIVSPGKGWLGGSEESAKLAVVEWLHECVGDDANALGYHVAELLKVPTTHCSHWAWHTNHEDDDPELVRLDSGHTKIETFAGWLFSATIPAKQDTGTYLARKQAADV